MKTTSIKTYLQILSIIFSIQPIVVKAQNFYFGIYGGLLKNAMLTEDYSGNPSWYQFSRDKALLNSFNYGVNIGYQQSSHWAFELQVQKVNLRSRERLDLLYDFHSGPIAGTMLAEVDWYRTYSYIRIPILVNYNIFQAKSLFNIGLLAGTNFGFVNKQTSKYVGINELGRQKQNTLYIEDIPLKNVDFGLQFGLRTQLKLNRSMRIFIDGSVYQGLPSIIDYPDQSYNRTTTYYDNQNIVNRHYTINIGVQYDFIK